MHMPGAYAAGSRCVEIVWTMCSDRAADAVAMIPAKQPNPAIAYCRKPLSLDVLLPLLQQMLP
jgi:hypothetical protein